MSACQTSSHPNGHTPPQGRVGYNRKDLITEHVIVVLVLCLTSVGLLGAQGLVSGSIPPGTKLYIAPMEWNLDRCVAAEIREQGLSGQLVALPEEADFVGCRVAHGPVGGSQTTVLRESD